MLRNSHMLGLALSVIILTLPTSADIIQFSNTVTDSQSGSGSGTSGASFQLSATMTLPQFDPTLGELTGVSWDDTITADGDVTWSLVNESSTETANVSFELFNAPSLTVFPGSPTSLVGVGMANEVLLDPSSMTLIDLVPGRLPEVDVTIDTDAFSLLPYIGTGTMTSTYIQDNTLGIVNLSGLTEPNDLTYSGSGALDWTRTITYTYAPVPEPASSMLLGLGGMTTLRRQWKKTDAIVNTK